MHLVKQIAKQILMGLDYMHRCCGVIHTGAVRVHAFPLSDADKFARKISSRRTC